MDLDKLQSIWNESVLLVRFYSLIVWHQLRKSFPPYHTVHYRKYGNIGGFMSMMFGILMLICCCSLVSRLKKRQQMNSMPVFSSTAPAPAVHVLNQPPPGSYPVQLPPTMTPYPQPPYFGKPGDSNGYPMPPPPAYTPTATNEPHQQAPSAPEYPPYPSYSNYPSAPQK